METMMQRYHGPANTAAALSTKRATMAAHDLLAPLASMQQNLLRALADSENNRELLISFLRCSEVMTRICHSTIDEDSGGGGGGGDSMGEGDWGEAEEEDVEEEKRDADLSPPPSPRLLSDGEKDRQELDLSLSLAVSKSAALSYSISSSSSSSFASPTANVSRLVQDIEGVISPYPKRVYLKMDMGRDLLLRETELYVGNDLKVTRCAINLLVHACDRADRGHVSCRMFCKDEWLVVEVEDYGPAIPRQDYPTLFQEPSKTKKRWRRRRTASGGGGCSPSSSSPSSSSSCWSGLGLWSVANNIDSLGGDYGYYTKEEQDSRTNESDEETVANIFWFSVPTTKPSSDDGQGEGATTTPPPTPKKHPVIGKREHVVEKDTMVSRITDESIQHQEPPISVPMGIGDDLYNMDMTFGVSSLASRAVAAAQGHATETGTDLDTTRKETKKKAEEEEEDLEEEKPGEVDSRAKSGSNKDEEAVAAGTIPTKPDAGAPPAFPEAATKARKVSKANKKEHEKKDSYEEQLLSSVQDGHYDGTITTVYPRQRRQGRVLVIDDSITVRKNIDRTLSRLGYCVVQASNGMQGLKELQVAVFDVVLVDFLMPVMDGIDCVVQYRQWEAENRQGYRQYLVGISAHGNDTAMVHKGLDAGLDKFLPKPVSSAIVKQLCDSEELKKASDAMDAYLLDEEEKLTGGLGCGGEEEEDDDDEDVRAVAAAVAVKEATEEKAKEELKDAEAGAATTEDTEAKETVDASSRTMESTRTEATLAASEGSVNSAAAETATAAAVSTNTGRESSIAPLSPPCCLIGMNSKPAAVALSRNIEARGWRANIVANGFDALRLLKVRRWDAVFLDEKMPRLSGTACISKFRDWEAANGRGVGGERRQAHVYLLQERYYSSSSARGAAIMPAGADGVIGKPLRTKDLTRVLTKAGRGAATRGRNSASLAAAAATNGGGVVPRRRSMSTGRGNGDGAVAAAAGGGNNNNNTGGAGRGNVRGMMKSLSKRILLK